METIKITDFMSEDFICMDLKSQSKQNVLKELNDLIGKSDNVVDREECLKALLIREEVGSTGIGKGVAIPHAKTDFSKKLIIGFGRSREGIEFESLDNNPAKLFFVFASPLSESQIYLKILARISRLIRNVEFRDKLLLAESSKEIIDLIDNEEK